MLIGRPKKWTAKPNLGAQIDWSNPLTKQLVGCYLLNEGVGARVHNLALPGTGAFEDVPTWVRLTNVGVGFSHDETGTYGTGLSFDGTNDAIDLGNPTYLQITDNITVEAQHYLATDIPGSTSRELVAKDIDVGGRAWTLEPFATGGGTMRVLWYINGGTGADTIDSNVAIGKNRLYTHVGTYRSSDKQIAIYENGVLFNSGTAASSSINTSSSNVHIGRREYAGFLGYWDGVITRVRIWNRALSADEIRSLYVEPYGMFLPASPTVGRRLFFNAGGPITEFITPTGTLTTAGALTASTLHNRLYFDSAAAAPASPSFDGGWSQTTGADRKRLNHVKQSSAMAAGSIISWANTAGTKALNRQYISAPLSGAQTINGTVKMQLQVREEANTDNVDQMWIALKVVSIDGGTVRGTLLTHNNYGPTGEFIASAPAGVPQYRNKKGADGDAVSSVSAQDGDRILLEIGYSNSGAGTTPEARGIFGDTGTDLPEDETTATSEAAGRPGWIEFSVSLAFRDATTQGLSATTVTAGNVVKQVGKIM